MLGIITSEDIELLDLFPYDLAPIPTSLFSDDCNIKSAPSKSKLETFLEVEQSSYTLKKPDCEILDVCAVL